MSKKIELTDREFETLQWALDMADEGIDQFWYRVDEYNDRYEEYTEADLRRFRRREKRYRALREKL